MALFSTPIRNTLSRFTSLRRQEPPRSVTLDEIFVLSLQGYSDTVSNDGIIEQFCEGCVAHSVYAEATPCR